MLNNIVLICALSFSACGSHGNQHLTYPNYAVEEDCTIGRLNLCNYFTNLTTNIGDNPACLCVDVAMCMIISYYDTYYNDNIIPEEFDIDSLSFNNDYVYYGALSSPGIVSSISSMYYSYDPNSFSYYMTSSQRQQYLLTTNDYMVDRILPITKMSSGTVINLSDRPHIRSYLAENMESINGLFQNFSFQYTDVMDLGFDACKEAIDNGYPIILDPHGEGQYGHAAVAFDYDENTNSLIFHNGFKYGQVPSTYGDMISSIPIQADKITGWAFSISPSQTSQHVCSNNYYELNPDGSKTYYCPCMLNGMSYSNHNHNINHTHSYAFNEDDELIQTATHYESCPSCLSLNQNLTINDDYSYASSKVLECDIDGFVQNNDNTHTITFICNNTMTESHHVIDFECVGTDVHEGYCICGSLGYESHDWCLPVMIDGNIEYICICGLIHLDHDETWRNSIRNYLRNHDYFDDDFFIELISELLSSE